MHMVRLMTRYLGFSDSGGAGKVHSQFVVPQTLAIQVLHSSNRIFHISEIDKSHIAVANKAEALDASVARKLRLQLVFTGRLADASNPNGANRFSSLEPRKATFIIFISFVIQAGHTPYCWYADNECDGYRGTENCTRMHPADFLKNGGPLHCMHNIRHVWWYEPHTVREESRFDTHPLREFDSQGSSHATELSALQ